MPLDDVLFCFVANQTYNPNTKTHIDTLQTSKPINQLQQDSNSSNKLCESKLLDFMCTLYALVSYICEHNKFLFSKCIMINTYV